MAIPDTEIEFAAPGPGPMYDGHFPGSPILPGARLLDLVLRTMALERVELQTVKFVATVAPSTRLRLVWSSDDDGRIRFECRDAPDDRLVASGKLRPL